MKKAIYSAIAAGMAAITALVAAPVASAAPVGNIVTFGDSFTANPDQILNTTRQLDPSVYDRYPSTAGCLQAPDNWPRRLGKKLHAPVSDWSCTAQTSRTMLGRLDQAIKARDVNPSTRSVVVAVGMNNFGGFGALDGVNFIDWNAVRANYIADIQTMANKVRRIAPKAKIVVAGALSSSDPKTSMYCPVQVVPNDPQGLPVIPLDMMETANRQNQIDAARQARAAFVDIRPGSAAHSSCAPDNQRWVAGIVDTTTPNYNMIFHPTSSGEEYMARMIQPVA